ncbi:MAG: hypothetical protein HYV27_09040 [Candidatus Hydrogenedentes bacterium]|nr:hypothetical protein [Candidatus Hydrogenedentota bacterium]
MKGIEFVIDDAGERKAVLIDLEEHGELWEDFYDALLAQERRDEPRESLAEVKEKLSFGRN